MLIAKKFQRVAPIEQLIKQPIKNFDETVKDYTCFNFKTLKQLKTYLARRDMILSEDKQLVAVNVEAFLINNKWDKAKTIKLVRLISDMTDRVAFYGWNSLMLKLDIQYGSKESVDKVKEMMKFIKNHIEAYRSAIGNDKVFSIEEFPHNLADLRADALFCKDKSGESCYTKMWKCVGGVYYVYEDLFNDLLKFGYTREQLRTIIHCNETQNAYEGIPKFLIKKYFYIPDGSKAIREAIIGEQTNA